jgi:NitT/TauT family transport system substrate-binding protein
MKNTQISIPAILASAVSAALLMAGPAMAADSDELRIERPLDLANLPLLVAEHEKLIQKHADMAGVGNIKVRWVVPGKTGTVEALGGGSTDFAVLEIGAFVAAWDQKTGTAQELRAVAAIEQMPYVLVARNPAIRTILDFTEKDRIAVPASGSTGPGVLLQMAAAQQWGGDHFNKLDPLLVATSDAEAATALTSGKGDIDAHFSRMPYSDDELADKGVHRVMDSVDIAGPHTTTVLAATKEFHNANPRLCAAVLDALDEADKLIRDNPGQAAEIYVSMAKTSGISVEDLADMIGDPDLGYSTAPAGVKHIVDFLQQTGRLKHKPASWKDLFFVEAQNLSGS